MLDELKEGARRNPIWFGSIGAITAVQAWLGWEFWGALTDEPAEQFGLRMVGMAFVAGEVVALDMASRAALQREPVKANTLRAMWVSLALINLAVDVNALSRVLAAKDVARETEIAAYDARLAQRDALKDRIAKAEAPYAGKLLPVSGYAAALVSKDAEIALAAKAPAWRQRALERERGEIETRKAVALEIAQLQTQLDAMEKARGEGPKPTADAAEFAPLAKTLTGAAQSMERMTGSKDPQAQVTSEDVRAGVAVAAAIVMKIMLTAGVWVGLDRQRQGRVGEAPGKARREEDPIGEAIEEQLAAQEQPKPTIPSTVSRRQPAQVVRFGRGGRMP
jgi:hypothetical protein